jgi:hypothetical protein
MIHRETTARAREIVRVFPNHSDVLSSDVFPFASADGEMKCTIIKVHS